MKHISGPTEVAPLASVNVIYCLVTNYEYE